MATCPGPRRARVVAACALVAAVLAACGGGEPSGGGAATTGGTAGAHQGPEGVVVPAGPELAPVASAATGRTVDGIQCQAGEQVLFHVHAHLAVFVEGSPRRIPAGIGIAPPRTVQQTGAGPFVAGGACFYWLHTHSPDGIIHVESPVRRGYTLGQFFDLWGQPLTPTRVGPATGPVTAFVDGAPYRGDPAAIPLGDHQVIQLDVGHPVVPPQPVAFPQGL